MNMNDDLFLFFTPERIEVFLLWPSSHNNPSTPFSHPKSIIIPIAMLQSQKGGRYKIYSKNIFQFSCSYLWAILFWLSMKRKQKSWKWNNSRIFFSPVVFLQFGWDLKVFQEGFEIFISRHLKCSYLNILDVNLIFSHSRISMKILKKCLLKDLTFSSQNFQLKDLSLISIFHT